jgi:phage tail sheath protein FI
MPEYLAPGVYVEEVSFRSKSIEGVPTSTTGYAGVTRWGPVQYPGGPRQTEPRLITNFQEFERVYGGLEPLEMAPDIRLPYTAHAARAFFMNGGKRLYVSRVFTPGMQADNITPDWESALATRTVAVASTPPTNATWRARWPGKFGNVLIRVETMRTKDVAWTHPAFGRQATGARSGAVVMVTDGAQQLPADNSPLDPAALAVVVVGPDGRQSFFKGDEETVVPVGPTDHLQLIELLIQVEVSPDRTDEYSSLGLDPRQRRYVGRILQRDDPEDEDAVVWLDYGGYDPSNPTSLVFGEDGANAIDLLVALMTNPNPRLEGGTDGLMPAPDDLDGKDADLDNATVKATGLRALGEIDDIAIVALPDAGTYPTTVECRVAAGYLVTHAERLHYRIAVVDAPQGSSMNEIRSYRGQFDSRYAAMYHPWVEILDPTERAAQGSPPRRILLPPSGFVTGIYARSDVERGVFKAPANEVVQGLTKFEANINKARQDVLNPAGINALRFFPGRGNRVWGARTMSSDPEWKYVNVRRLFIFLEHSIDKATQWAVFEPNNDQLWANIRQSVEDFLYIQWRDGALFGAKPADAYFVRCDRTTMTQNDIDNGRMICLIGVAPTMPAEFVIFRIGQWTAGAKAA